MKTIEKPILSPLHVGKDFKVLKVTGGVGADMPLHYCTGEAVITILNGIALLKIDNSEYRLTKGNSFIIPSGKHHSLGVLEGLIASVVMPKDADINFVA